MAMKRTMKNWTDFASHLDVDDVLDLIGLERRRSAARYAFPIVGTLLLGAVVGAGLGVLFAPRSGRMLRMDAERKVDEIKNRIRTTTEPNNAQNSGMPGL